MMMSAHERMAWTLAYAEGRGGDVDWESHTFTFPWAEDASKKTAEAERHKKAATKKKRRPQ